jgi:hypothetical protein
MNLFKEHGVRNHATAAAQIPVIDFGPVFGGEPGALGRVAAATRRAIQGRSIAIWCSNFIGPIISTS